MTPIKSIIGCLAARLVSPAIPRRGLRLRCALTITLLAATVHGSPAQDRERARLEAELKRYHGFVNAYQAGNDDAVAEILAWDRDRLTAIIGATQTPLDVFRTWDDARVRGAAMLHTDAAMRVLDGDDARLPFQLGLAARLLYKGGAEAAPFARNWYTAVVRVLRDRALLFVAEGLLEDGRRHLPRDPIILYESGVLQEQIATFSALTNVTVNEIPLPRGGSGSVQAVETTEFGHRMVVENRRALRSAAGWLQDSARTDPSSELAQLHLGRVQSLRGNYDEAAKQLRTLATSAGDRDTSYLATMFLGAIHQRRGRHAEAEQLYRQAIQKVPSSQSAYVALSEVLQKLGRGDESREVLMRVLHTPAASRTEPWWWYLQEPIGEATRRLASLRDSVRP